ncbi:MAG: TusE/DsrC/DsvC family sulfur relay protein [Candidatus Dasytiphilus stammeri]
MSIKYENIDRDSEGFLINSSDWNEFIAEKLAREENLDLSEEHWKIIILVRTFYLNFNMVPTVRMLVKTISKQYGIEKGNSRYLFKLFPKGPAKQAAKIAGIPKPVKCL